MVFTKQQITLYLCLAAISLSQIASSAEVCRPKEIQDFKKKVGDDEKYKTCDKSHVVCNYKKSLEEFIGHSELIEAPTIQKELKTHLEYLRTGLKEIKCPLIGDIKVREMMQSVHDQARKMDKTIQKWRPMAKSDDEQRLYCSVMLEWEKSEVWWQRFRDCKFSAMNE